MCVSYVPINVCYVDYQCVILGYISCALSIITVCLCVCYVDCQCVRYVDCHYLFYVDYHCDMFTNATCHVIVAATIFCQMPLCILLNVNVCLADCHTIVKCHCLFCQILLYVLSNGTVFCVGYKLSITLSAPFGCLHSAALFFSVRHLESLSVLFVTSSLGGYC